MDISILLKTQSFLNCQQATGNWLRLLLIVSFAFCLFTSDVGGEGSAGSTLTYTLVHIFMTIEYFYSARPERELIMAAPAK